MMTPLEVTQALFTHFGNHDVDNIMQCLDAHAVIDFYGPEVIPYAGHYEGADDCRRFFETVLANVNIHVFEPEEFIVEGNKVVVVGHLFLTTKSSGKEIRSPFVHVIHCKDGKWVHFRDFMNTSVAEKAFS